MTTYDLIVLGTGGVGGAALFHAARRGLRVLGLDRFPPGHDRGSSHGETRIIRQAYFEHSDYVPLLLRAYALWGDLEQLLGVQLFRQAGLLQVGPPDGVVVRGVLQAARLHGLAVDSLSAKEAARRFPAFAFPPGSEAAFEAKAGYLWVERCVLAHLAAAKAAGAELQTGVTIAGWSSEGGGLRVQTSAGVFSTARLVIAPGPWAPELLGDLGVPLTVRRKHVYWFEAPPVCQEEAGTPTYLFELPHGVFYGFPGISGQGLKVGEHSGGAIVADPLIDPRSPNSHDQARVQGFLAECLPSFAAGGMVPAPLHSSVCYYTMSPDENFVVGKHPRDERVAFACGLSGHGFKFVGALGEALVDLLTGTAPQTTIDFLSPERFLR